MFSYFEPFVSVIMEAFACRKTGNNQQTREPLLLHDNGSRIMVEKKWNTTYLGIYWSVYR